MVQKAEAEFRSICISKVLPEKKLEYETGTQLAAVWKIYFLKKVDFRVYWKEKHVGSHLGWNLRSWTLEMTKSIFNLYFSIILKEVTLQQMCYTLASRPLFLFQL